MAARPDMPGSKRRRLAWLIQKLEEMRSTNASRRNRAIRAWLRPDGIMAMIVEALALAEELDGGRWLNWVDVPGEPKGYLAPFPRRAQYDCVLGCVGPGRRIGVLSFVIQDHAWGIPICARKTLTRGRGVTRWRGRVSVGVEDPSPWQVMPNSHSCFE